MGLAENLRLRLEEKEMSQAELARRVGLKQPTIASMLSGKSQGSSHLHKIARVLETTPAYLMGETDDPEAGAISNDEIAEHLDMVPIRELDWTLGMGGQYLGAPVTETTRWFPREWLRTYTRADPDNLIWAIGIGDSMAPTILDSDLLLIDLSQNHLNVGDKFWAFGYGDVGMVKRLRPMPDGSVKLLSDNAAVPEERAYDGELTIFGRVVGIVRKM